MKKCVRCGKRFEDTVNYKGKNYCAECIEVFMQSKATCSVCNKNYVRSYEFTSDDMDTKDKKKNFCSDTCYNKVIQDRVELDELDKWLKSYHKTDKLNNRIYMQIQQFKSKNNFTVKGIQLTLEYIVNTLKKNLEPDTIGIVAWYYDNAKDEYIKKINRQQKAKEISDRGIIMFEEKQVFFKPIIDNRRDKILITTIDFEGGFDDV